MLEDYCNQLQNISNQKNRFLKLKYKQNQKNVLQKQENKYHRYILSQISYKNRLDAVYKFNMTINQSTKTIKKFSFHKLQKYVQSLPKKSQSQKNAPIQQECQNQIETQKLIISNAQKKLNILTENNKQNNRNSLVKKLKIISSKLIFKSMENKSKQYKKYILDFLKRRISINNKLQKLSDFVVKKEQFLKNDFLEHFKIYKKQILDNKRQQNQKHNLLHFNNVKRQTQKSFIFSLNQFSQIFPYTIEQESSVLSTSRADNIEQIDSKFKPLSISHIQTVQNKTYQQNQYQLMFQSLQKLKQQVLIMKKVLSQKNNQLKLKDQNICKIKKQYQKKIEHLYDILSSKVQNQFLNVDDKRQLSTVNLKQNKNKQRNLQQSYLKQLQDHIIGDRSPRGQVLEETNLNQQLLQKYMKEAFQMRQKMDMARQMCEQFQFNQRTQQGQLLIQIIKLLTPQQRMNVEID